MPQRDPSLRGRDRELAHFRQLVAGVASGRSAVVLIEGPPGVGRSRLLTEFVRVATEWGFSLGGSQFCSRVPAPQLVPHGESAGPVCCRQADPDARDRDGDDAESRLPVLIPQDDVKHGDEARLLSFWAPFLPRRYPVLWILARDTELAVRPARTCSLPPGLGLVRMELDPLDEDAVAELMADLLEARPSSELRAMAAGACGNPLLLVELISGLREEGLIAVKEDGQAVLVAARIPARVRRVCEEWVRRADLATRSLIYSAATCHPFFTVDEVSDLLGTTVVRALPLFEEAADKGILVLDDNGTWSFRISLLRQVLREAMPAVSRSARGMEESKVEAVPPVWELLNERQRAIASLVRQGLTNQQVASRMGISLHTVSYHLRNIFFLLGISSRTQLSHVLGAEASSRRTGTMQSSGVRQRNTPVRSGRRP
ncbi:helix-turn-helix transcriptional regulator [Streptomyces torulosus]|uniref:helix-turn-helix transcriptional regulator n=1 Tax=Streptomyces torulosus TaxID=68276 RepID=UPI0006EBC464|nr:LuxR family transcriptional regulator [Streptomyces torulosus]